MTDTAPVATRYTYEFVRAHLPEGAASVLEIGCGNGELAARLLKDGIRMTAIDNDAAAVENARALGVDAHQSKWPAALDQKFDAVLFTRSLHHIDPLDEAVAAAVRALRPQGRLIVEDFRAEGGTVRSTAWFDGLVRLLRDSGAFEDRFELDAALAKAEPDDGHHLHSSRSIANTLAAFGRVERQDAAYYFRYLEPEFRTPEAAIAFLEHEIALISAGSIDALGKRFILEPH